PADESGESAARVLLIAQTLQMLDAIFDCLYVAEHHRRARLQSELMRDLHHFEPFGGVAFQRRNSFSDTIDQNLSSPARDRAQARLFESPDHVAYRHLKRFRKMLELRGTEAVNVYVRIF